MPSLVPLPEDTTARFTYLEWKDYFKTEKGLQILSEKDPRKTNVSFRDGDEELVHDVRPNEADYNIDTHGFAFVKHQSALTPDELKDTATIESRYISEAETVFRHFVDDIDEVYVLGWRVRCTDTNREHHPTGPTKHVHIDQSPPFIEDHVRNAIPDRADHLLKGRVRLVNIWRPINGPVESWPLAVCDARSCSPTNMIETDRVRPEQVGNTRFIVHDPNMKWYYKSQQRDDEIIILKNYDSDDKVAQWVPHAAFLLPDATAESAPRESIEIRAIIFTYPKEV